MKSTAMQNKMGQPNTFRGLRALVVGLGRFGGGVGVTRWLANQGAKVTVTDQAEAKTLRASLDQLSDLDLAIHLGGHDFDLLSSTDIAVINPAVHKAKSSFFLELDRRHIPWTTETNLFVERCPAPVIAVTGSYGKSTTATMLHNALVAAHTDGSIGRVFLGGNIGRSLLAELGDITQNDTVILELSNAQLEDMPRIQWSPTWAILTNVHPHHLDRYASYEQYIDTKLNVIGSKDGAKGIVVGAIDETTERCLHQRTGHPDLCIVNAAQYANNDSLRSLQPHDRINAACALAIVNELRCDREAALATLASFAGLPHRLQRVGVRAGVTYINDSKSTAPANTLTALQSCPDRVIVIVGGQEKDEDFRACATQLARRASVVICMGQSGPRFSRTLRYATDGTSNFTVCEVTDLESAVKQAQRHAGPGDTVLFSPGAPSFDRYLNFEQRGEAFIDTVQSLS